MQKTLSKQLLEWYTKNGRDLPWRVKGGPHPDPYVILVSEIMLQQTTVKTVIPYFQRFIERFPTVQTLADAPLNEVYLYWQGLGYYSRARSLHATAQIIVRQMGSIFPQTRSEVLKLKGIGNYTAASFLALAFNKPETVVDGNVIRVICRMYRLTDPAADILPLIRQKAEALTDKNNAADYASAIMDLGALICTPQNPRCLLCPWHQSCLSTGLPDLEQIPKRTKTEKKIKRGKVFLIYNRLGQIYIRKKTEKGLLSGLYEFPWSETDVPFDTQNAADTETEVSHTFTHFRLTLRIYTLKSDDVNIGGIFVPVKNIADYPFSTLMKKIWQKAATLS